jgi:putative OPT family oligopeptide transporter
MRPLPRKEPWLAEKAPFRPFVADGESLPELTFRALALGSILGLVFGASSAYLGLKVGLTVSASVPIAVLSITIFRGFSRALGSPASILENNIVQTAGSAGESIAGGVIFTIPALIFLGFGLDWTRTMVLALTGGILGVLMMIPLRRYLIVKEHGVLTYPEGTACAEVLIVGEHGGSDARLVFAGLLVGLVHKALVAVFGFFKEVPERALAFYNRAAVVSIDAVPELLGVGYIIGPRSAAIMAGGGALAWLVFIPAIAFFGDGRGTALYPATTLIGDMSPDDIWNSYIRYIGAGAVAAGGIVSLGRALPTILDSFAQSFRDLRLSREGQGGAARTERDIPINWVLIGSIVLAFSMALVPQLHVNVLSAVLIIIFGFFFSVVSSRITGELGSSSCPISGMAIATLMGTCLLFVILGWQQHADEAIALSIGGVVCIAASNAGTTSQDLKTGYLVGATPWKQQVAMIVGVLTCVFVVGLTVILLNESLSRTRAVSLPAALPPPAVGAAPVKGPDGASYVLEEAVGLAQIPDGSYLVDSSGRAAFLREPGIGSANAPGPQARLMSLVIRGILSRKLPWGLVLIGVFTSLVMEVVGIPSLAFAVGVYLPLNSTAPIFCGGVVRALVDRRRGGSESDAGPGVLFSSGLIAGGSLMGLAFAALQFDYPPRIAAVRDALLVGPRILPAAFVDSSIPGLLAFLVLAFLLYRFATRD